MGKRGRPPHPDILTPREWQVLELLRQNLTNEQIAQRLDISPATAKYHVAEIISKLGVTTREEAAAWQPEPARSWWQSAIAWVPRRAWPLAAAVGALAALAALGLLVADLSGDGNSTERGQSSPRLEATSSQTPRFLPTTIAFPEQFVDFVQLFEDALNSGNTEFFPANTVFSYFDCGSSRFPAAGPNCVGTSPESGVPGLHWGLLQSQGDVLDQASYQRFIEDLLGNYHADGSDAFGGPLPRIYAIADMLPEIEGDAPGEYTYAILTTRIAGPIPEEQRDDPVILSAPEFQRQVMIFFVTSLPEGWRITNLTRAGTHALDPYASQAAELGADEWFEAWERWCQHFSPAIKGGHLNVGWLDPGRTLCWWDTDSESSYEVEGEVVYYPGCDSLERSVPPLYDKIPFSVALPANSTQFQLPKSADERFSSIKELTFKVMALDESGEQIALDGTGGTTDCIPTP